MTEVVDARGLSCPQPVILTKRAMDKGQFPIEVWV
ncbi:MAG: sulfurtransferase TusA family protein, partial [Anaerolineae bacterium]